MLSLEENNAPARVERQRHEPEGSMRSNTIAGHHQSFVREVAMIWRLGLLRRG
jgi:hypothetical protein